MTTPGDGLREVASRYPAGVVVVSSRLGPHDHAMTATAFMSVSLDPPLALVSIGADSRMADAIEQTGRFNVSILSRQQRAVAQWLATPGRPVLGQLARVRHHRGENGLVLVDDAVAYLECDVHAVHEGGDHVLVLGAVRRTVVHPERADPLVYHERSYGRFSQ